MISVPLYAVVWMLTPILCFRMQGYLVGLDVMPFHDCSVLSSFSSGTSDSVSQCGSIAAGLRIAHLNCHSLLSVADEVYDLLLIRVLMFLLLLRHGKTLLLLIVSFFLTPHLLTLFVMITIIMVAGLHFFYHQG